MTQKHALSEAEGSHVTFGSDGGAGDCPADRNLIDSGEFSSLYTDLPRIHLQAIGGA